MRTWLKTIVKIILGTVIISFFPAVMWMENERDRHFVETHQCSLVWSDSGAYTVMFGHVIRVVSESVYACKNPDVGVSIDWSSAKVSK